MHLKFSDNKRVQTAVFYSTIGCREEIVAIASSRFHMFKHQEVLVKQRKVRQKLSYFTFLELNSSDTPYRFVRLPFPASWNFTENRFGSDHKNDDSKAITAKRKFLNPNKLHSLHIKTSTKWLNWKKDPGSEQVTTEWSTLAPWGFSQPEEHLGKWERRKNCISKALGNMDVDHGRRPRACGLVSTLAGT